MLTLFTKGFKWAFGWFERFTVVHDWFWPVIAPVAVAVLGYAQAEPWMWIAVAMAIVFACISVGTTIIAIYVERQSPLNKHQSLVTFGCDLNSTQAPAQLALGSNRSQRRAQKAMGNVRELSPTQIDVSVNRTVERAQLGVDVFNTS